MDSLWQDFRYALRLLSKAPGFTAIVVLILALGIGANAAIYSIVDVIVLQPLPGKDPRTLVRMYSTEEKGGTEQGALSLPIFKDYRENLASLSGISAYRAVSLQVSQGNEIAQRVKGEVVSENFFEILGISPLYGRLFSESDNTARGSNPVVVLGERLWKEQFDGRPNVIGSTLRINNQSFAIIGVAPNSLQEFERGAQLWLPMSMAMQAEPMFTTQIDRIGNDFFKVVGRLKPGVSLQQAQAELDIVAVRLGAGQTFHLWAGMEDELVNPTVGSVKASEYPEHYDWKKPWPVLALATKGFSADENRLSWLLLGVTALVLLIATSDVAGLLLARSEHEEKERAIRSSLGATRWSLLRFQLVRGLLLATLGSVAGLFASSWASKLLFASAPEGLPLPVGIASSVLGFRVIAFVLGISCVAGVGFSILPELRRRASELSESLKQQVSGLHAGSSRASRLQVALVFSQIAASILLLVGAGLLIQTTRNIARIDLGFDTDHVLSATLDFSRQGYTKAQAAATIRPLLEKVKSLPGVSSAALVAGSPVTWRPSSMKSKPPVCNNLGMTIVSPGYFQTLQIPFLRGRDFTSADEKNSPGVLILNQAAANLCWKDQDPIGKSVPGIATVGRPFEIIGIVANIRVDEDDRNPRPHMYTAISQFFDAFPWQLQASILARTNLPPHSMVAALNSGVRSLDPNLSLYDVQTPRELLARSFDRQTFFSRILSVFGLLAFVLAIAGLYGLLAYVTAKRSREFGIRMALGALPGQIFRLVLQQGGVVTAAGVIAGLVAVAGASRFLQSVLFGVSATDGRVFLAVGGFFLVTGLLACFLPARRATRVDPVIALRDE